ncbi:MAG TPA: hypothetical protein VFY71_14750 [Planctomycetota bacterium]|nr:hypothetical protein [Planctomycetota bacterium]
MKIRFQVGERVKHDVEASYSRGLRWLHVRLDGRLVYSHCALLPWSVRKPREFRSQGPEVHFYMVDPPGWHDPISGVVLRNYRLWLDGQPVATLGESADTARR